VTGKLSAVVISYSRAAILGTGLRALGFADEVIVVDKSSTDATRELAARQSDRVVTVPWTLTVEDTRAFAVAQCSSCGTAADRGDRDQHDLACYGRGVAACRPGQTSGAAGLRLQVR
jgi:hypothetical protein